jgi:hypothetical protein
MTTRDVRQRIRRSRFTREEDQILMNLVSRHGLNSWHRIAGGMPGRNCRQCRDRWNHYLCSMQLRDAWLDGWTQRHPRFHQWQTWVQPRARSWQTQTNSTSWGQSVKDAFVPLVSDADSSTPNSMESHTGKTAESTRSETPETHREQTELVQWPREVDGLFDDLFERNDR